MNVGIGVGDLLAVGALAWNVYKSCKGAPESFQHISLDVLSLHAVLKEAEETLQAEELSRKRRERLDTVTQGCRAVLTDLQALVDKYESLGAQSKRTWDRMKWSESQVTVLRERLASSIGLFTAFISISQVTVAKQLNKFMREFQNGSREASVISTRTCDSISSQDKELWRAIRKELESIGVTVEAFNANKDFIFEWFTSAVASGAFEERPPEPPPEHLSTTNESNQDLSATNSEQESAQTNQIGSLPTARSQIPKSQPNPARIPRLARLISVLTLPGWSLKQAALLDDYPRACAILYDPIKRGLIDDLNMAISLISASKNGNRKLVTLLLENGARIEAKSSQNGIYITALIAAVKCNNRLTAELLLSKGADINATTDSGSTALMCACSYGYKNMVQMLLAHGADVALKNERGYTAMLFALTEHPENISRWVMERAFPQKDSEGIVSILREYGA